MKFVLVVLILLPLVMTNDHKRMLIDSLFQAEELKTLVSGLVHTLGTDETEVACEKQCGSLIKTDHLLQFACTLVCHSLQSLAHRFDLSPSTPMPTAMPSGMPVQ